MLKEVYLENIDSKQTLIKQEVHRGLILGPSCCRFIGGSLTVIAACSCYTIIFLLLNTIKSLISCYDEEKVTPGVTLVKRR